MSTRNDGEPVMVSVLNCTVKERVSFRYLSTHIFYLLCTTTTTTNVYKKLLTFMMRIKKKSVLLGLFCREGAPYTIVDLCTFINLSCVLVYYAYLYVIVYYVAGMM